VSANGVALLCWVAESEKNRCNLGLAHFAWIWANWTLSASSKLCDSNTKAGLCGLEGQ